MRVLVRPEASVGFGAAREGRTNSVLGELGNFFSPEFMNRFDGIIEFETSQQGQPSPNRRTHASGCPTNASPATISTSM